MKNSPISTQIQREQSQQCSQMTQLTMARRLTPVLSKMDTGNVRYKICAILTFVVLMSTVLARAQEAQIEHKRGQSPPQQVCVAAAPNTPCKCQSTVLPGAGTVDTRHQAANAVLTPLPLGFESKNVSAKHVAVYRDQQRWENQGGQGEPPWPPDVLFVNKVIKQREGGTLQLMLCTVKAQMSSFTGCPHQQCMVLRPRLA